MLINQQSARFDYETAPQVDSVVLVAAGPSTANYHGQIIEYVKANKSIVFAANYNYGDIKSNFTYYSDHRKFIEQFKNIDPESKIILREWSYRTSKKAIDRLLNGRFFYRAGTFKPLNSIYRSNNINIGHDGSLNYTTIGCSGLALLTISLLCRPKKMLISGIDGPLNGDLGNEFKKTYSGSIVKADHIKKTKKIINFLENIAMPNLTKRGIRVESFSGLGFYNLDKKKIGMEVIG